MFPNPMNPIFMSSTMPGMPVGMKFSTTMFQMGNNTGIEVPADVIAGLGAGKRPAVVVTVNGYEYRSTVAPMGGRYLLPFSAERRKESGIQGGDAIEVELTLDSAPRTVDVPDDLRSALDGSPRAHASWEKLSYTIGRNTSERCSTPRRPTPAHGASPRSSPSSRANFPTEGSLFLQ